MWHIHSIGTCVTASPPRCCFAAEAHKRHMLEPSSRTGLQRVRRVCSKRVSENTSYLVLARKILIFLFSVQHLTPESLGISQRMQSKLKQKNFPALISVFLTWITPVLWDEMVPKSGSSRNVWAATSVIAVFSPFSLCSMRKTSNE